VDKQTSRVVVVGGGTAGWITASLIAATHGRAGARRVAVTLIESPDIPIIGVGEGTWPSMRATLQTIGIDEGELIRSCDASFKQGTEFIAWADEEYGAHTDEGYFDQFGDHLDDILCIINVDGVGLVIFNEFTE